MEGENQAEMEMAQQNYMQQHMQQEQMPPDDGGQYEQPSEAVM